MDPNRKPVSPSVLPMLVIIPFLTGSIADIDDHITDLVNIRSLYPRTHPEHIKCVYILANERWARYGLSGDKQDRDKYIVHTTEAILLPPVSQDEHSHKVVRSLYSLANVLQRRFVELEQLEDIKSAIKYLRYLRGLDLDPFALPRHNITTALIQALFSQVDSETSEAGVGTRNIKEMVVLCRELLTSDLSADFPVDAFNSLSRAIETESLQVRDDAQLADQVVECVRDAARMCPPDSHKVFYALANTLRTRFSITHSIDDYEEATALLDRILDPNQPGMVPDRIRDLASSLAIDLALIRSSIFPNPQNSEVTISRLRTFLGSPSVDERSRRIFTGALAMEVRDRFEHYGLAESLEEVNSSTSQFVDLSSPENQKKSKEFHRLMEARLESGSDSYSVTRVAEKIQHFEGLLSTTPPGTDRHNECLRFLGLWYDSKFNRTDDISDIEESIKYFRLSLDPAHSENVWRIYSLSSLRDVLNLAFEKTKEISYLDETITIGYDIFEFTRMSSRYTHFLETARLVQSLFIREKFLGKGAGEDRHEVVRLIPMVIDNPYAYEPYRFSLSCQWAFAARSISHPTTETAYKTAMSLMQKSLSFAPTVSIQHTHLVKMGEDCQTMPLGYASYQVGLGRVEEAVETLEQGRALLWTEMRGLHASVAGLIEDLPCAERLAEIN